MCRRYIFPHKYLGNIRGVGLLPRLGPAQDAVVSLFTLIVQ